MSERKRKRRNALWPEPWTAPDDRPPMQGGAVFRREDIDAAIARGAGLSPQDRQALLMGTFPDRERAEIPNATVARQMVRAEYEGSWPRPVDLRGLPRDVIAFHGKLYDRDAVDRAMAQDRAERERLRGSSASLWIVDDPPRALGEAAVIRLREMLTTRAERRAIERAGRILVAWLIGRWRR